MGQIAWAVGQEGAGSWLLGCPARQRSQGLLQAGLVKRSAGPKGFITVPA